MIDELRADVRYGLRGLRRSPGFAAAAMLSLALGIGANTAVFSLLDTVLLKSLPVQEPEQLVLFAYRTGGESQYGFSYRMLQAMRGRGAALADVAASASFNASVDVAGALSPSAQGQLVSGNYYAMLGVPAALGRLILPDDDRVPGASAVAVLGYAYWQRQFGGDSGVIGRVVRINGYPFTVVGVSAPEFFGTHVGSRPDVIVPLAMQMQAMPEVGESWIEGSGTYQPSFELIGRLLPGARLEAAQAELSGIFRQRIDELIAWNAKARVLASAQLALEPGSRGLSALRQRFSRPLAVLMAVVVLVLLIACANVANLLLARAAARRREMALRLSLGAGRARLVRQLFTESLILAVAGGAVGLLFAWWASRALAAAVAGDVGHSLGVTLDWRVLAFTLGASLLTAIAFGLVPAISASGVQPQRALGHERHAGLGGRGRAGLGALLVAGQVALSLLLLVGAGLFVRTLMNLRHVDLGFTRDTVLVTRLEPRGSNNKHERAARLDAQYVDLLDRVRALPGVRAASLSGMTPIGNEDRVISGVEAIGAVQQQDQPLRLRWMQVYPDYFATLGIPFRAGRDLTLADTLLAPEDAAAARRARAGSSRRPEANVIRPDRVAIVNETMAVRMFGSAQAAIGRAFRRREISDTFTIVGVVGDVRDRGVRDLIEPLAYASFLQTPTGRGQMTLAVRVSGDAAALRPAIREHVRAIDPAMPLRAIDTVAHRLDDSLRQERVIAWLSSAFGLLALLLACIGLYGVMAYGVARRTAEFGLRLALGASRRNVSALVLRQTWIVIASGLAIGVPLSLLASRLVSRMLFGLSPTDPVTLLAAVATLTVVATSAGYLPARRAGRVDPLAALRQE